MTPRLTAVVCTWNRVDLLEGALDALLAQEGAPAHEILVVDNASSDRTRAVVDACAAAHPQVQYLFEPRPGLAHARNTAMALARGDILAFVDDDVRVEPQWAVRTCAAFDRWPDAACVGGPVLPRWLEPIPPWLTRDQWAPLGLQDYGPQPFRVDGVTPVCLIGANLAFRRDVLARVGAFNADVQRVRDGGGSTEDHELHLRLWAAGMHGMYDPAMAATALVVPERLRKAHHRAWHFGHGRHIARMRIPDMEATTNGRVFGVPGHLLREAAADAWRWTTSALRRDAVNAFAREAHLWFIAGFVWERWV